MTKPLVGRCIGCFHDFSVEDTCGGCGAIDYPWDQTHLPEMSNGVYVILVADEDWASPVGCFTTFETAEDYLFNELGTNPYFETASIERLYVNCGHDPHGDRFVRYYTTKWTHGREWTLIV